MKKIFFLTAAIIISSCMSKRKVESVSSYLCIVGDSTDALSAQPKAAPILGLFHFEQYPNQAALFRFRAITDLRLVPVKMYHLPNAEEMDDNGDPQYRNKIIQHFYSQIKQTLDSFQVKAVKSKGLPNSECWRAVNEELKFLADSKATRKVLLVYSNLFENSFTHVYRQKLSSKSLCELFEKTDPPPKNLHGITAVLVFNPRTRIEDERFHVIANTYKQLIERRGGVVHIQADATQFD